MFADEADGFHGCQIFTQGDPGAVEQALDRDCAGVGEVGGTAIERPCDAGGTASDQGFRRIVGRPNRDVGVAFRQVERLVAEHDIQTHLRTLPQEGGEQRRQQMDQQRVVGRHPQFARRR